MRLKSENAHIRHVKIADQTSNVRFLATDPTDSMTFEECGEYIQGAKQLADQCRGISPLLDELFDSAYRKGMERYFPDQKS